MKVVLVLVLLVLKYEQLVVITAVFQIKGCAGNYLTVGKHYKSSSRLQDEEKHSAVVIAMVKWRQWRQLSVSHMWLMKY